MSPRHRAGQPGSHALRNEDAFICSPLRPDYLLPRNRIFQDEEPLPSSPRGMERTLTTATPLRRSPPAVRMPSSKDTAFGEPIVNAWRRLENPENVLRDDLARSGGRTAATMPVFPPREGVPRFASTMEAAAQDRPAEIDEEGHVGGKDDEMPPDDSPPLRRHSSYLDEIER